MGVHPNSGIRIPLEIISSVHEKVHDGQFFYTNHVFTGVTSSSSVDYLIKTDSNEYLHSAFEVDVGADCRTFIYEGTTVSNDGTALTAFNSNRSSSNTLSSTFFHTPTVTGVGTLIKQSYIPGTTGRRITGGGTGDSIAREGGEVILKPNETYLVRITNVSSDTIIIATNHSFYLG